MKKLWNNSSKLYKVMAIVLTLIMVVTPLYIHFDKRYDAKADENIDVQKFYLDTENNWCILSEGILAKNDGTTYFYGIKCADGITKVKYSDGNNNDIVDVITDDNDEHAHWAKIDVTTGKSYSIKGYVDSTGEHETNMELSKFVWENDDSLKLTLDVKVRKTINGVDTDTDFTGDLIVGGNHTLVITITTGYELDTLSVLGEDISISSLDSVDIDDYVKKYTYTYQFIGDNTSNYGTNKYIEVKDKNSNSEYNTQIISCTSLKYDKTPPSITETGLTADATKYYKSPYVFTYDLSPGDSSNYESDIVKATSKLNDNSEEALSLSVNSDDRKKEYYAPGQNTVTFYIEDEAGNYATKDVKINIDNSPPETLPNPTIKKDGSNIDFPRVDGHYFTPDSEITISAKDDIGLSKIVALDDSNGILFYRNVTGMANQFTVPLYELLGKTSAEALVNGDYYVKIYSYDSAISSISSTDIEGNISVIPQEKTLKIDGTKPELVNGEQPVLVYQDGGDYPNVEEDEIDNGVYKINKDIGKTILYKVKIKDEGGSGIKSVVLKYGDKSWDLVVGRIPDYYSVIIPYSEQTIGTTVEYTIVATDNAGNTLEIPELTPIQVIDSSIRFSNVKLEDEDGNVYNGEAGLASINEYSNKKYTLTVTTVSGNNITEVGLKDASGIISPVDTSAESLASYDKKTKLYTVTTTLDIPAKVAGELKLSYNTLKVYAEDAGSNSKTANINLLMYDSTLPIVRNTDKTTKITTDTIWHKSFTLPFAILSGTKGDDESPLASAGYSFSGTDAGTNKDYTLDGEQTSVTDSISIPESNNTSGTTITFHAKDKATNSMSGTTDEPISFTFKIDATNPTINSFTAAGSETNTLPLAGDPAIAMNISDNLTIDTAALNITLPDGTTKDYIYEGVTGEQKDISVSKSYALSQLLGSAASDGLYKIKLTVKDKAGNSDSKEITFTLDNTVPEFTADIVSGTSGKNNGFYNTEVQVKLTVKDANFNADKISVTDNDTEVALDSGWTLENGVYTAKVTVDKDAEGVHSIKISGTDSAGVEGVSKNVSFTIDKTLPEVSLSINGSTYTEDMDLKYFNGTVAVKATVSDANEDAEDLRIQVTKTVPGQQAVTYEYTPTSDREFAYADEADYTINFIAVDKANNSSTVRTVRFNIDKTAPVLSAEIISGTSGKQNNYYNTDVAVRLTCIDNNFNAEAMSVTDNGTPMAVNWTANGSTYYTDVTLSAEGLHDIVISGADMYGTSGISKQVSFVIDKSAPTVALLLNGGTVYNESMGTLNLTGVANINVSVTDSNDDLDDLRVQVIKTVPDTDTTTTEFMPTSSRSLSFSEEADYIINIYAVDRANNQSVTRTISFRIDTTAPTLTISGANGGTSASAVSVGFNITESFWSDASGTVTIYRIAGDGQEETLYKTLTVTPNQRAYTLSELIQDTGIYRFEFEARDRVGHTVQTEQSITVDRNKPEIRLTGVNNYDVTDGLVSVAVTVSDEFFQSKTVSATGTVIRADGTRNVVGFAPFSASGNPTAIEQTFSEDGIYDITISSRDIAGNESAYSVHFTIDTTAPVIKDLSEYDGKTFNSIDLDLDLDELVSDLTVCDVRMYLNGSEYDGVSDIEDGSYTLLITAEDELGHKSEQSATFVLDTKAPVFIVTGVEDGDVKDENYDIEITLQLDEDKLTSVKLNDKDVLLSNNNTTATLKVTDRGVYELYMAAVDPAGNEAEQIISFVYGDEEMAAAALDDTVSKTDSTSGRWWLWLIAAAVVLGGGGFIFILLKRRKSE